MSAIRVCSVWEDVPAPFGRTLQRRIVVPYPVEAPLSGLRPCHFPVLHICSQWGSCQSPIPYTSSTHSKTICHQESKDDLRCPEFNGESCYQKRHVVTAVVGCWQAWDAQMPARCACGTAAPSQCRAAGWTQAWGGPAHSTCCSTLALSTGKPRSLSMGNVWGSIAAGACLHVHLIWLSHHEPYPAMPSPFF